MARGIRQGIIDDRLITLFTLAAAAVMLGFLTLAFFLRVELQLWGNGIVYNGSPHETVAELYMDIGSFSSVSPGQRAVLVLGGGDTFSGKVLSRSISPGLGSGSAALFGDARQPNSPFPRADDMENCRESGLYETPPMGCFHSNSTSQMTPRSSHPAGLHACMADGSVRFINDDIDAQAGENGCGPATTRGVWQRLHTRNGGEIVSLD